MLLRARQYGPGLLVALVGACVVLEARTFGMGTLARTGPGLYPSVLGGAMVLVGVLIALTDERDEHATEPVGRPDWRGWSCIVGGVLAFILIGEPLGLGPAAFACVFIAAWGDRAANLLGALLLAAAATSVAGVVFAWALKFQLPFVRW